MGSEERPIRFQAGQEDYTKPRGRGRRQLGELAGVRSAAAVHVAIRRYEVRLKTDRIEPKRAPACTAHLKNAANC
jgi:hypothetical protein